MTNRRFSVAMTDAMNMRLAEHLIRPDGQEDICLGTYRTSTGNERDTAIVRDMVSPHPGEREVHGNASITGDYVLRAASIAHAQSEGLVICHSHPRGRGWQAMSRPDRDAESSFANLAREITGMPLVGMTLAGGDGAWSARRWDRNSGREIDSTPAENVRTIGNHFVVSWNDDIVPAPQPEKSQRRSISCWGQQVHDDLIRRSVLVVGAGSVGLDVALRLAATGVANVGIMDFDVVEEGNLDRLIGATPSDAWLRRAKVHVARRLVLENATTRPIKLVTVEDSVCEASGLARALDYDMIVCCVDRPWPRAVLNQIAYTDLIPVIDGGIAVDVFEDGSGMRNATWRSHVIRPGRPCLACNGQLDLGLVAADIEGILDDPSYIAGRSRRLPSGGENVSVLSISAAAAILAQYVSFNVAPGGIGEPGPLQYLLSTNTLERVEIATDPQCRYEKSVGEGDYRLQLTGDHPVVTRRRRERRSVSVWIRGLRAVDSVIWTARMAMASLSHHQMGRVRAGAELAERPNSQSSASEMWPHVTQRAPDQRP